MRMNDDIGKYSSIYRRFRCFKISGLPLLIVYIDKYYDAEEKTKIISSRHEELFYLGMVRGNDIDFEKLWTFICYYAKKYGSLEYLLESNVNIDQVDEKNKTMLMIASDNGNLDVVRGLICAGCALDVQDKNGYTALINASFRGHAKIVEELINSRCRLDVEDSDGISALIWSTWSGSDETVNKLIAAFSALESNSTILKQI